MARPRTLGLGAYQGQVVPNTIDVRVVCTAWHLVPATSVAFQRQHRHRPHREEYTYSSSDNVLEFGVGLIVQHVECTHTLNRVSTFTNDI